MPDSGDPIDPADLADVVELLTVDHKRIQGVIDEGDPERVVRELAPHLVAEGQLVYPDLRHATGDDDLVDAHLDADHQLEEALVEVDKGRVTDLAQVAELFAAHVRAQEEVVFPKMRAFIDQERMVELADALGEVLRTAPLHPHPHNPDEGFFEVISDAVVAEIDKFRHRRDRQRGDG